MAVLPLRYGVRQIQAGFRQHGYTLHDALITLSVIGIITTIATPSLLRIIEHQRLVSAANTLLTALMTARSESIKRNSRTVICPSRDGSSCIGDNGAHTEWHHGYLLFADDNANRQREPEEPLLQVFGNSLHIRIYSSAGRDHVTYQSNGHASGTNATFLFCGSDPVALRTLVVSNTGRARLGDGGNACPAGSG